MNASTIIASLLLRVTGRRVLQRPLAMLCRGQDADDVIFGFEMVQHGTSLMSGPQAAGAGPDTSVTGHASAENSAALLTRVAD